MLRVLLVMTLILIAPLQGMARGGFDVAADRANGANVALEQSIDVSAEASGKSCCGDTETVIKKPSFCKTDCKAVISTMAMTPVKTPIDRSGLHVVVNTSIEPMVDLRPPIS